MLQTATAPAFPFPGSKARDADGIVWTVVQSLPGGEALLTRDGMGASGNRRAAIADLDDPTLDDLDAAGLDRLGIARLKWLRAALRDANAVVFASLKADMQSAAGRGECPSADGYDIAGLLRRLGWEKSGNVAMPRALTVWRRTRPMQVAA